MPLYIYIYPSVLSCNWAGVNGGVGWGAVGGHNKEASKWASSREGGGGGEEVGGFYCLGLSKERRGAAIIARVANTHGVPLSA